jgi:hypothetical protein
MLAAMNNGIMEPSARPGFCVRCDAPIYSDEDHCGYCGGGKSGADFHAVAVLCLLVISGLGGAWLLLG